MVEKKIKQAILSMIGSWTTQHTVSWRCDTAKYEEDVRGRIVKWRANEDGTRNMLTDSETLSNRKMFLIGRIPLVVEHATLFKMRPSMRIIEPPLQIHGCVNDCFYVTKKRAARMEFDIEEYMLVDKNIRAGSFRVSGPTHQAPLNAYQRQTVVPKPSSYRTDESSPPVCREPKRLFFAIVFMNFSFLSRVQTGNVYL